MYISFGYNIERWSWPRDKKSRRYSSTVRRGTDLKKHTTIILGLTVIGFLQAWSSSLVSACGTCSLGRGTTAGATGQLMGMPSGTNPFHAGVSFESTDPMNSVPSSSAMSPINPAMVNVVQLNGPINQPNQNVTVLPSNIGPVVLAVNVPSNGLNVSIFGETPAINSTTSGINPWEGFGGGQGGVTPVPEPAALALFGLGLFAALKSRRR